MSVTGPNARLAVDIGGTFTDIVLVAHTGRFVRKLLTTPRAPELAVMEGARAALAQAGLVFSDIGVFVHGTTLATNAIIERKGASTALIATEGFRDVVEIADEGRFDQYDINIVKPAPLVPRQLRFTMRNAWMCTVVFGWRSMRSWYGAWSNACGRHASRPWP